MSRFENRLTALHFAMAQGRRDMLDVLIDLGADLEATDGDGHTPLETAMLAGDTESMRLLQAAGARTPQRPQTAVSNLAGFAEEARRVTAMLRAWVGDVEQEAADRLIEKYVSEYGETRLAWSGSATPGGTRTYIRLDGPSIWIEFSNRPGEVTAGAHPHTIVRDETADYGGG